MNAGTAFIPTSLHLESMLGTADLRYLDYFHIVLDVVAGRALRRRDNTKFVSLSHKFLRTLISSKQVAAVMRTLCDLRVLETNGHYVVGRRGKGYRLTERWAGEGFRQVQISNRKMREKLDHVRQQRIQVQSEVHQALYEWLETLEMDVEMARAIIPHLMAKKSNPKEGIVRGDPLSNRARDLHYLAVECIAEKELFCSTDRRFGRLYTNITSLRKELRLCLRYRGQSLANVDIKNSQPFILAGLIKSHVYKSINPLISIASLPLPLPSLPYDATWDADHYIALVCEGGLYEQIMERGGVSERAAAKESVFTALYCDVKKRLLPEERVFQRAFPGVFAFTRQFKGDDYRRLARSMQIIEAEFMFERVCRTLMRIAPTMPLYTIHDSILTTCEAAELVSEVIRKEAERAFGLVPRVQIEWPIGAHAVSQAALASVRPGNALG